MSAPTATNEQAFRRLFDEAFSQGSLSVVDEIVAPNFVEHQRGAVSGVEGLKRLITMLRAGFPDLTLTIEDMATQGDKVWGRIVARGTHLGPMMGKPPTGVRIQVDIIDVCRFVDGRMVEHWGAPDTLGMMEQIGLLPTR